MPRGHCEPSSGRCPVVAGVIPPSSVIRTCNRAAARVFCLSSSKTLRGIDLLQWLRIRETDEKYFEEVQFHLCSSQVLNKYPLMGRIELAVRV